MLNKYLKHIDVDVVIISWAKNTKLHQETISCIKSLVNSEKSDIIKFHITIVESNKDICYDNIESIGHTIKTIYSNKPFGYHTYLNIGLNEGNSEWTCLCNSDLIFKNHWATEILKVILAQRQHDSKSWEYVSASPANPREDWHYNNLNNIMVGYAVRQHVAGWCLFQSRNIFQKIGKLEERIKFWFCDNWYSVAMQFYKIPHIFVGTSIVEHHNNIEGTTTKESGLSDQEKHQITYGAGDEFRDIIRELIGDDSWGRPTEEVKNKLKEQGRTWY